MIETSKTVLPSMSRRVLKQRLLATLQQPDLPAIVGFLQSHPPHLLLNPLFIALCNPSAQVRWHAVYGFGQVVSAMADKDPESARIVMRRFLWSLNDESGGIGWGAPEAMAEIMFHSPLLRQEYLHMLVSYMRADGAEIFQDGNYLELPLLQRGLLWGIGRLCQRYRSEMMEKQIVDDLFAYLSSPDHQVIGLAIWCLGMLGGDCVARKISTFLNHPGEVQVFFDNSLHTLTVAKLAEDGLKCIKALDAGVL
jgi:hypothetical protein